jgi:hypothetical protein
MAEIINKVAESALTTINLEHYLPSSNIKTFDLKDYLFMGLILKEKEYREALKQKDFSPYNNSIVCIICSADAIIPSWAYMLATTYLQAHATAIYMGTEQSVTLQLLLQNIQAIDVAPFTDKRLVIKGCGNAAITEHAYVAITHKLLPVAKSIMYGEPCSTVPIYKKK